MHTQELFPKRHDITVAYLCKCKKGKVTLNNEHFEHKLLKSIPAGLHLYLLETIQDSKGRVFDWVLAVTANENGVDVIYIENVVDFKRFKFVKARNMLV
jgi:hypothetical protein